ncbi:unnamed protein product [Rhodiola kirilowii]
MWDLNAATIHDNNSEDDVIESEEAGDEQPGTKPGFESYQGLTQKKFCL